jgi:uncharacterized protein YdhG (YjbR/CyaY superfamily)
LKDAGELRAGQAGLPNPGGRTFEYQIGFSFWENLNSLPGYFLSAGMSMREAIKTSPAKDIDEYLASVPEKERDVLSELRRTIRAAAPGAQESISYRMPAFSHHGPLVFFAAFKNHLGFYGVSKKVLDTFKSELKPWRASTTTLHFSAENPLPASLVMKIVRARVEENEARRNAQKRNKI